MIKKPKPKMVEEDRHVQEESEDEFNDDILLELEKQITQIADIAHHTLPNEPTEQEASDQDNTPFNQAYQSISDHNPPADLAPVRSPQNT